MKKYCNEYSNYSVFEIVQHRKKFPSAGQPCEDACFLHPVLLVQFFPTSVQLRWHLTWLMASWVCPPQAIPDHIFGIWPTDLATGSKTWANALASGQKVDTTTMQCWPVASHDYSSVNCPSGGLVWHFYASMGIKSQWSLNRVVCASLWM